MIENVESLMDAMGKLKILELELKRHEVRIEVAVVADRADDLGVHELVDLALDLDHAETAGAESLDAVGRAELRNLGSGLHRGAHDRGAFRNRHGFAIDG